MKAEAAALTRDRVNLKIINRPEATQVLAQSTLRTFFLIDSCNLATPELVINPCSRLKDKMQVSGIHITISQHLALSQRSKRGNKAGLTCSAFTA
jgi:hypothetical protein